MRFGIGEIVVGGVRRGIRLGMRMRKRIVKFLFFSVPFVSLVVICHISLCVEFE